MASLAVLQRDSVSRARLRGALDSHHELMFCREWSDLWETVHRQPVDGCILDPYAEWETLLPRALKQLRRRQPPLAIIVHSRFEGREGDLFELGRLQVDAIIMADRPESSRAIREAVTDALGRVVAERVARALEGRIAPPGLDCLRWSIRTAHRSPSVDDLAEAFFLSPPGLARDLRSRDLPSPTRFLLWGRLFRAAHMLDSPARTVESVAFDLGYSSGTALGRAFRRETGHPPTEVLKRGGVAWVLEAFLKRRMESRRSGRRAHGVLEFPGGPR